MVLRSSTFYRASFRRPDNVPVLWRVPTDVTPYGPAMEEMARVEQQLIDGTAREQVWVIESPAGYSRGHMAKDAHGPPAGTPAPVEPRGGYRPHAGSFWFHGPGVLGIVLLLDLRKRRKDVTGISGALQDWLLGTVQALGGTAAVVDPAKISGVWLGGKKIATDVLQLRQWVTSYGGALLVSPLLARFNAISPCGDEQCTVTSLEAEGLTSDKSAVLAALRAQFEMRFGFTTDTPGPVVAR